MEMEVGGEDASDSESDDFRDDDQLDEAEDDCEDDGQLEDQRLAVELLFQNQSLQQDLKQVIEQMDRQEDQEQKMLESIRDYQYFRIPREWRCLRRGSFFSAWGSPTTPRKNVDAVRRHLFLEKYKIKETNDSGWSWSEAEDASLIEVVRAQLMEELFRKVYYAKVKTLPKLERADFFTNLQKEIAEMSSEELWRNLEHKANWHRIAARMEARGFAHSAKECYIRYRHQVHPMLQKGHFTKEEDAALLKLSTRFEGFDWEAVAEHMPTARTAWRCFSRYQKVLNNSMIQVGWSEEQMALLRRSVRDLGYFHDDVQLKSWQTVVSRLGPGKSVEQCEALATTWRQHIYQIDTLPWSVMQHRSFELAMQIYGHGCTDWKMLGRHVPGRDLNDLCTRWTTLQCRIGDWTLEEDDALRGAIEKYGPGKWNLMRCDIPSRSGEQICRRFHQLFPKEGRLYDLLLATRRRVLSFSYGKKVQRQSTDLSASDFALHLTAESDQSARLTTGNRLADKHLSRINKKIASAGRATAERKRPLQDVLDDEASVGRPAKSAKKNPALCESEETEAKAPDSRRKSSKDSKGRKSAAQVKMELSDDGSHG